MCSDILIKDFIESNQIHNKVTIKDLLLQRELLSNPTHTHVPKSHFKLISNLDSLDFNLKRFRKPVHLRFNSNLLLIREADGQLQCF